MNKKGVVKSDQQRLNDTTHIIHRIGKSWGSLFGKMNSIRAYAFSKLIYHATFMIIQKKI